MLLVAGCTSAPDAIGTGSTSSSASTPVTASATGPHSSSSSSSSSSATQPGMLTGPGVDETQITLGTLIDPATDRGFLEGLQLWKQSVNNAGGICGRSITVLSSGTADVPTALTDAYRALGTRVLGFVTQTGSADVRTSLATLLTADQVPALTVSGTATDLLYSSPVVIGPTDDILAINALDDLVTTGVVKAGDQVGVVTAGSTAATNAMEGLRWYADRHNLTLVVQTASGRDKTTLSGLPAVFALTEPADTASIVADLPMSTVVVTTLAGYDPTLVAAADATHLDITMSTPAFGADHPGATAVGSAITAAGVTPGALTFAGYASGANWQRLLEAACEAQSLTRAGVLTALTTVGRASIESLLGGSDPSLPALRQLPATRSSAMAMADPTLPTGLRPLTGLIVAAGVEDYVAGAS